jgi:hypothetical protein
MDQSPLHTEETFSGTGIPIDEKIAVTRTEQLHFSLNDFKVRVPTPDRSPFKPLFSADENHPPSSGEGRANTPGISLSEKLSDSPEADKGTGPPTRSKEPEEQHQKADSVPPTPLEDISLAAPTQPAKPTESEEQPLSGREDRLEVQAVRSHEKEIPHVDEHDHQSTALPTGRPKPKNGARDLSSRHRDRPARAEDSEGKLKIGRINIHFSGRKKAEEHEWPAAPQYTAHTISEDWEWSCQYGPREQ